jgi:hypothetical protein
MDVLGIMYPQFIGYSWNVMHHLPNIFTLLILLLLLWKNYKVDKQDMIVGEMFHLLSLIANRAR